MEGTLDTGKLHKDLFKDKNSISLGHSADLDIKSLQQAKSDSERDDDILGIRIIFSQIRHGHHLKDRGQEPQRIFDIALVLGHGQAEVERGFSTNKEVHDCQATGVSVHPTAWIWL